MKECSFIIPFDPHAHLRNDKLLETILPYKINNFEIAVAMGNLAGPIGPTDSLEKIIAYRDDIMSHVPKNNPFKPIMTVMLTRSLTPEKLHEAAKVARVLKFIPGATSTNSAGGISFLELKESYYPLLKMAEKIGLIFSIHAELLSDANGNEIPEPEREEAAIPFVKDIVKKFPKLKIIFEHVSTMAGVEFVKRCPYNVAATITLHHLLLTERDVYDENGQIKNVFNYCKPVAKTLLDREFIRGAALSGYGQFFFGSDSAAHSLEAKLNGAAGVYTDPILIEKMVEFFSKKGKLHKIEKFMSINGRKFYGLPIPDKKITLIKEEYEYATEFNGIKIIDLKNKKLQWRRIV